MYKNLTAVSTALKTYSTPIIFLLSIMSAALAYAQQNPDKAALLSIHQNILDALLTNDAERLFQDVAEKGFGLEDGTVKWTDKNVLMDQRREWMKKETYSVYEDVAPPVVKISNDGSLAWLLASVRIEGEEHSDEGSIVPISMLAAWIELYEKRGGRWVFVGSASSTSSSNEPP